MVAEVIVTLRLAYARGLIIRCGLGQYDYPLFLFSSVQLKMVSMRSENPICAPPGLCAQKIPYALHPVSEKFPQRCLGNGSKVHVTDDGPLSSFQGRWSSAVLDLTLTSDHRPLLTCVHHRSLCSRQGWPESRSVTEVRGCLWSVHATGGERGVTWTRISP